MFEPSIDVQTSTFIKKGKGRFFNFSIPDGDVIPVLTKNGECPIAESDVIKVDKESNIDSIRDRLRSRAYAKHSKLTLEFGSTLFPIPNG